MGRCDLWLLSVAGLVAQGARLLISSSSFPQSELQMSLLSGAKASLFEVQARDLCPGKVPEDSGRTKLPHAQRHGTSLGHCPELELPTGHFDELICISRHFAAQVLFLWYGVP